MRVIEPYNPFDQKAISHRNFNYFHKHKFLFIHIPKTGGSSILKSLFGEVVGGHKKLTYYINEWGETSLDEYFTACIVREPVSRFLSAVNYLISGGNNVHDKAFGLKYMQQPFDINLFVQKDLREIRDLKVHFSTQSSFVFNAKGKIAVEFIGRFEEIDLAYKEISERLNLSNTLIHMNETKVKKIKPKDLSPKSLAIIQEIYKEDFLNFNYPLIPY